MILGLFFLVASIVIYSQLIQPAYQDAQSIKADELSKQAFLNSEKNAIQQVQALISAYQGQGQVQQVVSAALPDGEDLAGALVQIYGLTQASSIEIPSIGLSSSGSTGGAAYGPAAQKSAQSSLQKPVGSVNINLSGSGSYSDFQKFVSMLETNIRIFDVKSLGIQPTPPDKGVAIPIYHYNLSLVTYYQITK